MTRTGPFGEGGSRLDVTLVIDDSDPRNPFHHQYHPVHRYPADGVVPDPRNDWTILWNLAFDFTAEAPEGGPRPSGWGDTQVGGVFEEEFTGLKNQPVRAGGVFRLQRESTVAVLNDGL